LYHLESEDWRIGSRADRSDAKRSRPTEVESELDEGVEVRADHVAEDLLGSGEGREGEVDDRFLFGGKPPSESSASGK